MQRMYHHNSVSHLLLRRELEEYEKRHVANALRQGVMRVFAFALLGFCPRVEHDLSRIDHLLLNSVSHKSDLGLTLRPKLIARADEVIGSRPV